tara:strand:+ start:475 stop:981 length:507 start_codon:yes stop_codon:yes gene_type:complete
MAHQRHQTTLSAQRPTISCRSHTHAGSDNVTKRQRRNHPHLRGNGGNVTDNSHAFSRITITTTDMEPRFCRGDTLILQHLSPGSDAIHPGTEIACTTRDGNITIGRFLHRNAQGITLSQISPRKITFIPANQEPILYRAISLERYSSALIAAHIQPNPQNTKLQKRYI